MSWFVTDEVVTIELETSDPVSSRGIYPMRL